MAPRAPWLACGLARACVFLLVCVGFRGGLAAFYSSSVTATEMKGTGLGVSASVWWDAAAAAVVFLSSSGCAL